MTTSARSHKALATAGTLLLVLHLSATSAWAYDAQLAWSPVSGAAGYKAYARQDGGAYGAGLDVGAKTPDPDGVIRHVLSGLPLGPASHFAVTSYDSAQAESSLSNELSIDYATAAAVVDSDGDGLTDAEEDTNLNRLVDPGETGPNDSDTDDDGLSDGDEVNSHGTDPLTSDSDGDGFADGEEVVAGSDPTDPKSTPVAVCGNGIVEPGERCDGNCPSSCDDGNACTTDALTGNPTTCDVTCTNTSITQCLGGDGCCPSGCSASSDTDCTSTTTTTTTTPPPPPPPPSTSSTTTTTLVPGVTTTSTTSTTTTTAPAPPELPTCGNGILDAGEECDDGDLISGDCCSAQCVAEDLGFVACGVGECRHEVPRCAAGVPSVCVPAQPSESGSSCQAGECGDPTEDGHVTMADALVVLRAAIGLEPCNLDLMDANADAHCDFGDMLRILRVLLDLESEEDLCRPTPALSADITVARPDGDAFTEDHIIRLAAPAVAAPNACRVLRVPPGTQVAGFASDLSEQGRLGSLFNDRGHLIYLSGDYTGPLRLLFYPPLALHDLDPASRTFTYCAVRDVPGQRR